MAITKKVTSGPPHFVELEHHQPAPLKPNLIDEVFDITAKSLTALNIKEGASHTEIMITPSNDIFIIEVGGRMGGDLIGSHLVPLSTGYDYLEGVVKNAIGEVFIPKYPLKNEFAGVYYILAKTETITNVIDSSHLYPEIFEAIQIATIGDKTLPITSSDKRAGCVIYNRKSGKLILTNLEKYLKFI